MTRLIIREEKMKIRLHQDEAESFMAKAAAKAEKYTKLAPDGKSPYGFNHAHSHLVGMAAEHASWVLFTEIEEMLGIDLKIDPAFQDERREGECDLYVGGKRIEVKGIKYGSWLRFGPCVSARQLPKIKKKADIVLWALYNERCQEFTFEGYNLVSEIETIPTIMTGAEGREKIENYPVLSIIKPLQELTFDG
ncbi:hypothetical protein pEaSNUABM50_00513 [Erwinia phage pEa_SNUABM_50]|uniref:Uncharacterized protein n=4 Tax=Eneladusvirus BF TaxID=2560751 RepID=A0A7L8ZNC4_9CAUD|nr:hypothetical protein FDH34_gp431 [Serratia phage BF]QOI71460.1 hypothetical protein pEaSNUABM12_00543 [Erwinia phage pEa_SNUABM_12]QOI71963.1 hypothetical protein pEaSNUABM47_00514 [Erwinia phage pEa_SNUABM_47]QOI72503.1 hypothetical protein pEaSNUABM50_00513 [Erwinia phage pEa_SNUABM_50]QXO11634.1 hypothetical protein pEaSNUABM19_00523 [Erwinia phage pEa_SNUABM_19]QXO12182.1 hypothetical protein pEaSNUABM44_00521 [Erwinia phage pEa_SNUABM_44]QXO12738.1 hypothetical protein pEaSNUABM49_005